jgi:hypothetical protein
MILKVTLTLKKINKNRQKIFTNWFVRNFLQPTYKIDMCPLTCEKHMLFK